MPRVAHQILTEKLVRSLKPRDRTYEVPDANLRGLLVRVNRDGTRTFDFRFMSPVTRKRRRTKVGRYEGPGSLADARREARKLQGLIADGIDPLSSGDDTGFSSAELTFQGLFEQWQREYAAVNMKPRTLQEYRRILDHDILPAWGECPVAEIGPKRVREVLLKVHQRGGVIGNRTHSVLRTLFDYGVEIEILDSNPAAAVRKLFKEKAPKRVLTDLETQRLWKVWTAEGTIASTAMKLYLLTGLRFGELVSRPWNLCADDTLVLRADETKNGDPHVVYLSTQAVRLVESLREVTGRGQWMFPSPRRGGEQHIQSLNTAVRRQREASGLHHWSVQTLRRTAVTTLARLGSRALILDLFLNHKPGNVTHASYVAHRYIDELREATQDLGDHIEEVVGELAPVVRLHRPLRSPGV